MCQVAEAMGASLLGWVPVGSSTCHTYSLCHVATFLSTHSIFCSSQVGADLPTALPSALSTILASQPLLRPSSLLFSILLSLWCPARGLPPPKSSLWLLYPHFILSFS